MTNDTQTDAYEVGGKIRDARKMRKMNQEQLAELVGCGLNTVSRIEIGQSNMSLTSFLRFAEALEVSPLELTPSRFQHGNVNNTIDSDTVQQLEELIATFLKSNADDRAYLIKTARLIGRT